MKGIGLAGGNSWRRVDNVAAVGSKEGCCGVLACQRGGVDTNDKLEQVDVANKKMFVFGDDSHRRDARHSHHCEHRRDADTAH